MFDRDSFIAYVGTASGANYAYGLMNIERLYGADIDAEYAKDGCKALLRKLSELKSKQSDGSTEVGNIRNRISQLKRYIQFKDGGGGERMKIVEQIRECMKDVPLGTHLKRQEIIDRVVERFQANPASIIPSDYCYNMTNKGKTGTVNFFMNAGTGEYEYVGENYVGMGISDVVAQCKKDFAKIWADENYKWFAVQHFKDTWDIDAQDFASMLADAFSQASNLTAGPMYYPYKMICEFAKQDPETVRSMFKALYNEEIPLEVRYKEFRSSCEYCLKQFRAGKTGEDAEKANNHYQDLRAISVYLSFRFPDVYFLYKYKMYTQFRDLIGFQEEKGKNKSEIWKLENYNRLCNDALKVIEADDELVSLHDSICRGEAECFDDPKHHLLTQTIIYVGSCMTPEPKAEIMRAEPDEETVTTGAYEEASATDVAKNTILYGPPGTGKTYHAAVYAVAIIENKPLAAVQSENYDDVLERYNAYKDDGLVEFTTFHQSYGYEEFIEGIRPVMNSDADDRNEVEYEIASGIFKAFCEKAAMPVLRGDEEYGFNSDPVIWKVSLDGTGENKVRSECMEKGHIRLGWDSYGKTVTSETEFQYGGKQILNAFINRMRVGDIVLSCFSATTIDAIGVVTGEYEWHDEYERLKRLRTVRWLVKGIREDITQINNGSSMTLSTVYRLNISLNDVVDLLRKYKTAPSYIDAPKTNHVFIIDEINRGNISKVFGELITLIEPSKRLGQPEGIAARLPYSNRLFGVPDNVYLIGTMNTADRSIATIDTALRRRFQFKEMQPDPDVLAGISVEDISIRDMLIRMNQKISALYDREHTIGHAYFIPLKASPTIDALAAIFEHNILPLLQEYFYDDYEKIRLVLGDNNKPDEADQFIVAKSIDYADLFGSSDMDMDNSFIYEINRAAFDNIEAYRSI